MTSSNPATGRLPPRCDDAPISLNSRRELSARCYEDGWRDQIPSARITPGRSASEGTLGFQRRTVTLDAAKQKVKQEVIDEANSAHARFATDEKMVGYLADMKKEMEWEAPSFRTRPGLNGEFYSHPVHNRGNMMLTGMGCLSQGVDPMKNKMYICPVYEAPRDRHVRNASYEGARPRTTQANLKWASHEHWINSGTRGSTEKPFKVNHCVPDMKNRFGSAGPGIIKVHPPSIFCSTIASQNGALIEPGPRRQLG